MAWFGLWVLSLQQFESFVVEGRIPPLISLVSNFTAALTFPAFINAENLRDRASDDFGPCGSVILDCMVRPSLYNSMILPDDHVDNLRFKAIE